MLVRMVTGGGILSETSLWSNNSPSTSFSSQTVSLSDDINNYSYLKFKFNRSTSDSTNNAEVIYTVDEFKKYTVATNKFNGAVAFFGGSGTSATYARRFWYTTDTSVSFDSMYQIGGTYSDNGAGIPTEIIGMK